MISCTEFIPSYSILFTFIEENYGAESVHRYWDDLFDPEKKGPTDFLREQISKHGIAGCWNYWTHTLNEEAADFELQLNEADGWFICRMHHCPSKGRLLEIPQITPYHDYCGHCDLYRKTVEKYGLEYIYDFTACDLATCTLLIYDPAKFNGKLNLTPQTKIMKRSASDNQYFHQGFHLSMNAGLEYIGQHYGTGAVENYLEKYTKTYLSPLISEIKKDGLTPLKNYLCEIYKLEEAEEVLSIACENGGMTVLVSACPAVSYIKSQGRTISRWYGLSTKTVMQILAQESEYRFTLEYYDDETGSAKFIFAR